MDLIRIMIFMYIIMTPLLFIGAMYLTVRMRNKRTDIWLKRYIVPSFILCILMLSNVRVVHSLYPSFMSNQTIDCVSSGDLQTDLAYPKIQSTVGLITVKALDYVKPADVFDPHLVGYTNTHYYAYELIASYKGAIEEDGLLLASQQQPSFLMGEFPCAVLQDDEELVQGVYVMYMDARSFKLPYTDEWHNKATPILSYVLIEDYDATRSFDLQSSAVKEQVTQLVSLLNQ